MAIDDSIIKRINKLLALSTSPNENEAASALEMAHNLLAKHNLSMQDIIVKQEYDIKEYQLAGERHTGWMKGLYNAIADYNYCQLVVMNSARGHSLRLVGQDINIIATVNMIEYATEAIERMAKHQKGKGKTYIASYKCGIAMSLMARILQKKLAETKTDCRELVVCYKEQNDQYLNARYKVTQAEKNKIQATDGYAYARGYADGKNIALNTQIA